RRPLRVDPGTRGDAARRRGGPASGTDGEGHGDRLRRGGCAVLGDPPAGHQRRPRAHGRPSPHPRPDGRNTRVSDQTSRTLLLRSVRPYGEGDPVDVLVVDGIITEIGADAVTRAPDGTDPHDCDGAVLLPARVDLHTHLREPGRAAAARGGYTAVFAMANTSPPQDNQTVTDAVWRIGREVGLRDVHPVGAVTVGLAGEQLTEMGQMSSGEAQVTVFSDDGHCVHDPMIMRRALEYSAGLGVLVAQHAEEPRLTPGAVAHEGPPAARWGLTGWPRSAEESIVARDAILARDAGARVHICHATTTGTVELLRWAKAQGIRIAAEVTPHHLLLDD